MALTDPFPLDIQTLLEDPIQHLFQATVIPPTGAWFDLDITEALDLTFDMEWSPFVQAQFTVWTPVDPVKAAALDGRLGTLVRLKMGYRWGGTDYLSTMGTLHLHRAETPHPGGITRLTVHGAEMLLQDRGALKEGPAAIDGNINRTGVDPFIRSWIERAYWGTDAPSIASSIPSGAWNVALVSQYQHDGGSFWNAIEGVARAAGVRVFDDGSGAWHINPLPALSGTYAAQLHDGERGTITSADTSIDREKWHNFVFIQWDWTTDTGVNNSSGAAARVTSGPYRVTATNTREYREVREGPVSTEYARAYVDALLAKFMRRGQEKSFTAAAAYWLRPGMTIRTQLKGGPWEDSLVSAVTFSPLTGSMSVRTIRPEDYETGA